MFVFGHARLGTGWSQYFKGAIPRLIDSDINYRRECSSRRVFQSIPSVSAPNSIFMEKQREQRLNQFILKKRLPPQHHRILFQAFEPIVIQPHSRSDPLAGQRFNALVKVASSLTVAAGARFAPGFDETGPALEIDQGTNFLRWARMSLRCSAVDYRTEYIRTFMPSRVELGFFQGGIEWSCEKDAEVLGFFVKSPCEVCIALLLFDCSPFFHECDYGYLLDWRLSNCKGEWIWTVKMFG